MVTTFLPFKSPFTIQVRTLKHDLGRVKYMGTLVFLRYITIPITVVAINLIVHTVLPGNIILALVLCFTSIMVLIPSESTNTTKKGMEEKKIAFDELSHPLDFTDMTIEEQNLHKAMGSIFGAMAQSAGRDIYSSEITGTEENVEQENIPNSNSFSGSTLQKQPEMNFSTSVNEDIPKIRLEVSQDGKLHYIFLEEETDVEEIEKSPENVPDIASEDADFETSDDLIEILEHLLNEPEAKGREKLEKKLQFSE